MKFLLDTRVLLWTLGRLDLIPGTMRDLLDDPESTICFGVINVWEMVIKSALPRKDFKVNPIEARRGALGFRLSRVAGHSGACFCCRQSARFSWGSI